MNALDRQGAWNSVLTAHPGDLDHAALSVEGTIPDALRGGRYLLNGPGWMKIGERMVHPFDGHGYLRAVRFDDAGGASLRARFVRTPAYVAEAREGRVVHRGLATNPSESWWANWRAPGPRNVANTTVVPWAGALLCGWEGGRPHALDPATLETRGEADFHGGLPPGAFLAHMRADPPGTPDRHLVGLSIGMSRHTTLTFREFDTAGRAVATRAATVPSVLLAHDFVMTPRWYVLAGNTLGIKIGAFLAASVGAGTLLEAVQPAPGAPGTLLLVPRGRPGDVRVVTVDRPLFAVHLANAFDDGDDLVVDLCAFETFRFGSEFGYQGPHAPLTLTPADPPGPERLGRVRVAAGRDTAAWTELFPLGTDFPRVSAHHEGRDAPALYVAARSATDHGDPFDRVVRVDLRGGPATLWHAPPGYVVGEPVFAPGPDGADGDGWVLVMLYDGAGERAELAIFESGRVEAGPVARVHLPLLPYGFHGEWEPVATG